MKKTVLMIIVLTIIHLAVCYKFLRADTERPRYRVADPATQRDLEDLSLTASQHLHTGIDGSQQIPKSASLIDNVITSDFEGQVIYNLTDHEWCGSTMTAVSSAWVKLQAPTTACGH